MTDEEKRTRRWRRYKLRNTLEEQVARNLRQFRRAKGWHQLWLADMLMVDQATISNIEQRKYLPTLKYLDNFAISCNVIIQLKIIPERDGITSRVVFQILSDVQPQPKTRSIAT